MSGITSFGAYIPYYRLAHKEIARAWGGRASEGERAVANVDEDSITMAVEAVRHHDFPLRREASLRAHRNGRGPPPRCSHSRLRQLPEVGHPEPARGAGFRRVRLGL